MDLLKQALTYAVLVAVLYAVVIGVRHFSHAHVPNGFSDINGLEEFASISVDRTVPLSKLRAGDAVAYAIDGHDDRGLCFAWVVGVPGDLIGVSHGVALLNGTPDGHGDRLDLPDIAGLRIPANHLWVVSDHHQSDSFALGPIPAAAIYGRLAHLP